MRRRKIWWGCCIVYQSRPCARIVRQEKKLQPLPTRLVQYNMFSYAKSLLQSVFSRKRPLESDTEEQDVKRAKIDSRDSRDDSGFHRIRITNFPKKDWKTVRKQLIERGLKSMSKAPKWDYAIITASVCISYFMGRMAPQYLTWNDVLV